MRSRVLAIVVAVVVPATALVIVLSRGGSSHTPARLPILAGGGAATTLGAARPDAALYPYGGIVYTAGPGLPALDGSAHAYRVAAPDSGAARRLADAFGFEGVAPDPNNLFLIIQQRMSR